MGRKETDTPIGIQIARAVIEKALTSTVLRSEIIHPERLNKPREISRSGTGLVIVPNHFSRKEPVQVLQVPFGDGLMRTREVLIPIAKHQRMFVIDVFSPLFGIKPRYIVTKETVERAKRKNMQMPVLNDGLAEFTSDVFDSLRKGGITIIFPQGTRRSELGTADDNPPTISTFLLKAKRKGVKLGFLFVGVDAHGIKDYGKAGGYNLFKKYTLTIGNTLTDEEMLERAEGNFRNADKIVYEELATLVSSRYAKGSVDENTS